MKKTIIFNLLFILSFDLFADDGGLILTGHDGRLKTSANVADIVSRNAAYKLKEISKKMSEKNIRTSDILDSTNATVDRHIKLLNFYNGEAKLTSDNNGMMLGNFRLDAPFEPPFGGAAAGAVGAASCISGRKSVPTGDSSWKVTEIAALCRTKRNFEWPVSFTAFDINAQRNYRFKIEEGDLFFYKVLHNEFPAQPERNGYQNAELYLLTAR
jgi:hypothetical protein